MFYILLFYLLLKVCLCDDIYLFNSAINLSQAVYCNNTNNWKCKTCSDDNLDNFIYNKNSMKFITGYNKYYNSIYISIRGTENMYNWMNDIRFLFKYPYINYPNIGVENGLFILYLKIKEILLYKIFELSNKYNTKNLLLTGHSMGSIVTFIPFDLYFNKSSFNITLVTFGSPRIGNNEFVELFNKFDNIKSYRITHYYDIVPHVPQSILGYKHISQEIWYDLNNYKYVYCNDDIDEDSNCSNSCAPLNCDSINNHLNYLNISIGECGDC